MIIQFDRMFCPTNVLVFKSFFIGFILINKPENHVIVSILFLICPQMLFLLYTCLPDPYSMPYDEVMGLKY